MSFFVTSVPVGDGGNLGGEVHAGDRIGKGPWFNAKGVRVASNVEELHGPANQLGGRTSLDEHGKFVLAGFHDILTDPMPTAPPRPAM
jgi:hypothetical protein